MRVESGCAVNEACVAEVLTPERTMKDNVDELNEILNDCNCLAERLCAFLYAEESKNSPGVEIRSFDTAVISALDKAKLLRERLLSVNARFGA